MASAGKHVIYPGGFDTGAARRRGDAHGVGVRLSAAEILRANAFGVIVAILIVGILEAGSGLLLLWLIGVFLSLQRFH